MECLTGRTLKCFYALEGIDGAGKTTVVRELRKLLIKHGMDQALLLHTEPTTELAGLACRNLMTYGNEFPPSFSAYMFAADRYIHLYANNTGVIDLLGSGKMVLTDRYFYSSIVYQTCERDSREDWRQRMELVAYLNRRFESPEKVFFLKCEPALARERQKERGIKPYDSIDRLAELDKCYERLFERLGEWRTWAGQEFSLDGAGATSVVKLDASKDAKELAETVYGEIFA